MVKIIQKDSRIDLRVKADQKELLNYAASLRGATLSAFVMESALKEAQEVITEKTHFLLSDKQWKLFCDSLDSPAKTVVKLKQLFSKKSVFDE